MASADVFFFFSPATECLLKRRIQLCSKGTGSSLEPLQASWQDPTPDVGFFHLLWIPFKLYKRQQSLEFSTMLNMAPLVAVNGFFLRPVFSCRLLTGSTISKVERFFFLSLHQSNVVYPPAFTYLSSPLPCRHSIYIHPCI